VVRTDGTGLRQITDGGGDLVEPALTLDGSRIAFDSVGGNAYVINFDGSGLKDLGADINHLAWSPDGTHLVGDDWASYGGYNSDLHIYSFSNSAWTKLTSRPAGTAYTWPTWSPDGNKIAAAYTTNGQGDIVVVNADGTGFVNLTADWNSNESTPHWSPDGKFILFCSNHSGNYDVWAMKPDGTGRTNLTFTADVDEFFPAMYAYPLPPVLITNQPQSITVNAHDTATFSVGATGENPLSYQWKFYGNDIDRATNSTLVISNVTPEKLGGYYVTITNAFGSTNSAFAMLNMYPYLNVPFAGATNKYGDDVSLSVTAVGSEPLTYQWYQDGNPIEGATNQTWALTNANFKNGGAYTVVVSNPYGSVTNSVQQVAVLPTPPFAQVSLALNLCKQSDTQIANNVSTTALPDRTTLTSKKLLKILATDAYSKGIWSSNSFPAKASLALVNDTFWVIKGSEPLLNVMDIMALEYGEPQVTWGSRNLETGLASPASKVRQLAKIEFDDTEIEGGNDLHFYLYGVVTKAMTNSVPVDGVYTETLKWHSETIVGDGYIQGVPFTATGTISATGKGQLKL
jgi:Tol biopolymer transport system component